MSDWTAPERTYHCLACGDTGWVRHYCSEDRQRWPHARPTATYVTVCPCRATNPTWLKYHMNQPMAVQPNQKGRAA